jgi:signal transduction histidine kinase/ActR/RegA family two-component response regulator
MARTTYIDQELNREQQRLRQALAAGRMCPLDYYVAEDRFVCDSAASAVPALEPLNGSLSEVVDRLHVEDRGRVQQVIQDALDHGSQLEFEARIVAARRTIWLLVHAFVERDERGRAERLVGVVRDNTARKEGQVVRQLQAHGERLRALGEMASGIAHDLNQSLALITGYSDMARQELTLDTPDLERVHEMVEITAQAALEGGHALRGLLAFVRSQELMAEAEQINVHGLLLEIGRLTAPRWRDAPQLEGRPIDLKVDAEPELVISGSAASLREAITNLIFNAVDALPQGGSIRLHAWRQDDSAVIEVADTGTGIPRDVLPRIFDAFFTTKGESGTGLGLPQVRAIVERHGGTVNVESEPGRGTTFRLALPASDEATQPRAANAAERAAPPPQRRIRILVVEDEEQLARMASLVLNQRGHHAIVANSGEDALAMLDNEQAFDLVISDLGLGPGKNGWDLAETVRRRWPSTRFVLVTGWGAAIDPVEARARGVNRVIAKPYRIAELRQVADDVAAAIANE